MANPTLPNVDAIIQAGINPVTGLPYKADTLSNGSAAKSEMRRIFRLIDEQDAINRYVWRNIPFDLTSQEIERILYYRYQLIAFFDERTEKCWLMPYALDGTLDFYGRFARVHPLPLFPSGTLSEEAKAHYKAQEAYLQTLKLNPQYRVFLPEEVDENVFKNSCVILRDYTPQADAAGGGSLARSQVIDPLLGFMADIVPYLDTYMLSHTGIKGMRVPDADSQLDVLTATKQIKKAALSGEIWLPIVGSIEFQELTENTTGRVEDYLIALQGLDNLRLSSMGLANGGIFEKKAHELESENALNIANVQRVYQDGLSLRQEFCLIFNSIFGTFLWCDMSEASIQQDLNGDGRQYDERPAEEQDMTTEGGEDEPTIS